MPVGLTQKSKFKFHVYCDTLALLFRRRQWQPTPVLLPGESQGWWSLVGCRPWGRTRLKRLSSSSSSSSIVVQLPSHIQLCATPWTAARQASRPSPSPRACSNSCPSRPWCHPTISSSVAPFSSCPQSFPASGSSFLVYCQWQNKRQIIWAQMILSHAELPRWLREKLHKMTASMPRLLSEKTTNWQQFTVALPEKDIDDNGYFESGKKKKSVKNLNKE